MTEKKPINPACDYPKNKTSDSSLYKHHLLTKNKIIMNEKSTLQLLIEKLDNDILSANDMSLLTGGTFGSEYDPSTNTKCTVNGDCSCKPTNYNCPCTLHCVSEGDD